MEPIILSRGAFVLNRLDFNEKGKDPRKPHCPYNPEKISTN
jgi:hypothetical protein